LKTGAPRFSKTLVFINFAYVAIIVSYQKRMLYWNEVPYRTLHSTRLANES
jgi:hypothetical protein